MHINFRIVDNSDATSAFEWHRAFAAMHEAIYPRDKETFGNLVFDRSVWCAVTPDGQFQAMSYAHFSAGDYHWEIGGLMVAEDMRGKDLGSIMMRLPVINMLVNERPTLWDPPAETVAHILAGNEAPRRVIPAVGFAWTKPVEVPSEFLPGLKADEDGMVRGDEFHLCTPGGIEALAAWCDAWNGTLRDGTSATVDQLEGLTLKDWALDLRDLAASAPPPF